MYTGPEHPNARIDFFLISKQSQLFPTLVLQIVIYFGRYPEMPGHVEMVVGSLEVLDPALSGNADFGVTKQVNVRRRIGLKRRHDNGVNIVRTEALGPKNVLGPLLFRACDCRFGISAEADPRLVQNSEILRGTGVD